ncbi:hypothetical protein CK203_069488 [Vitis vinifera]|uniref:Uncharacterized protein n=1 Tax=Vitis vinifera TaxID=29760 RepID=A0A438EL51_VITVI|nr:hypothetical protein CK203_069488 [Vitis vinifera]
MLILQEDVACSMELLFRTLCGDSSCIANRLTGAPSGSWCSFAWPSDSNSMAGVSLFGTTTAISYCTLLWVLSISKGRRNGGYLEVRSSR